MNQIPPLNNSTSSISQWINKEIQLSIAKTKYAWQNKWAALIFAALVVIWLICDGLNCWQLLDEFKQTWNSDIDQIISFTTLVVAMFVWFGELNEEWKRNLPKRLTVRFIDQNENLILICHKAHLSHEADIRNLGQQIASQMCRDNQGEPDTRLKFRAPFINQKSGEICYEESNSNGLECGFYLHYEATFIFTKISANLNFTPGQYLKWEAPFSDQELQKINV